MAGRLNKADIFEVKMLGMMRDTIKRLDRIEDQLNFLVKDKQITMMDILTGENKEAISNESE